MVAYYTQWYEPEHPLWGEFLKWSEESCFPPKPNSGAWLAWKAAYEASKRTMSKNLIKEFERLKDASI